MVVVWGKNISYFSVNSSYRISELPVLDSTQSYQSVLQRGYSEKLGERRRLFSVIKFQVVGLQFY